jgi:hypothetical protein
MDALELIMEENGKGYDFKFESGMGLKNIKKRLDHLNASLHFDSTPGYTVIIIKIPLNN